MSKIRRRVPNIGTRGSGGDNAFAHRMGAAFDRYDRAMAAHQASRVELRDALMEVATVMVDGRDRYPSNIDFHDFLQEHRWFDRFNKNDRAALIKIGEKIREDEDAVRAAIDDSGRISPETMWSYDIEPRFGDHGGGGGAHPRRKGRPDIRDAVAKLEAAIMRAVMIDDDARRERSVKKAMKQVKDVDEVMRSAVVSKLVALRDRYATVADAVGGRKEMTDDERERVLADIGDRIRFAQWKSRDNIKKMVGEMAEMKRRAPDEFDRWMKQMCAEQKRQLAALPPDARRAAKLMDDIRRDEIRAMKKDGEL